jgi:maltose/moltooligosaccharide transporter
MGIFNFTITLPQIVVGACGGLILKYIFSLRAPMMLTLAGIFLILGSISVYFVDDKATSGQPDNQ